MHEKIVMQVDVRSAAVGGRRGDPRRQGARSGAGALRNLWQNMWRNNGEGGEPPADGTPGYQVSTFHLTAEPYNIAQLPYLPTNALDRVAGLAYRGGIQSL